MNRIISLDRMREKLYEGTPFKYSAEIILEKEAERPRSAFEIHEGFGNGLFDENDNDIMLGLSRFTFLTRRMLETYIGLYSFTLEEDEKERLLNGEKSIKRRLNKLVEHGVLERHKFKSSMVPNIYCLSPGALDLVTGGTFYHHKDLTGNHITLPSVETIIRKLALYQYDLNLIKKLRKEKGKDYAVIRCYNDHPAYAIPDTPFYIEDNDRMQYMPVFSVRRGEIYKGVLVDEMIKSFLAFKDAQRDNRIKCMMIVCEDDEHIKDVFLELQSDERVKDIACLFTTDVSVMDKLEPLSAFRCRNENEKVIMDRVTFC